MEATINERLIVDVTQAHIDRGQPGSCSSCPIALALKERYPAMDFIVGVEFIYLNPVQNNGADRFGVPFTLDRWHRKLLAGGVVEPIRVEIVR